MINLGRKIFQRSLNAAMSLVRRAGVRAYLIFACIFSILIVADLGALHLVRATDNRLFDSLMSNRIRVPQPDPDIVIIDIDEASLAGMASEQGRWPWPNQVLGELVEGIERQQPRAIVFDILFSDADVQRPQSDAAFNTTIEHSNSTFFPMLRLDPKNDSLSRIPVGALPGARALSAGADPNASIAIILPKVVAAIDNGRLGTHQVVPDKDGVVRRYPTWIEHANWRIPSLPQRIAEEFKYPGSDRRDVLLNWRGPPFTYHYVSFVDVYRAFHAATGESTRPENEFAGKIVLIGSTAPGLFDVKGTPMARIHPGVEILATAIDNFKNGDDLRESPSWLKGAAALLLIWSMAIALYRQTRIEVFDAVFGGLQAGLVIVAFAVLNFSSRYIDMAAPLSLGLMYFALARIYYGVSLKWLANSQIQDIAKLKKGQRLLAVLAIRLSDATDSECRQLKSVLDHVVARSNLTAGRISRLIGEPGFVQNVFAGSMLVYWLSEDLQAHWQADAAAVQAAVLKAFDPERLSFARRQKAISWDTSKAWTPQVFDTILAALVDTSTTTVSQGQKE